MNIHFSQVERKSQFYSYLLAAFAVFTALMLTLSLSRHAELHWSLPSTSGQAVQIADDNLPVPIPAPLPPAGQTQAAARPEPVGNTSSIFVLQAVPAPAPSVP